MNTGSIIVEACVASLRDAKEAVLGDADRLELNSALELGGLTPSAGLLAEVKRAVSVPVVGMIRPRPAGFCYGKDERQTMLADARSLLDQGADGIVFGVLDAMGQVERDFCRQLIELAAGRETVFHRAIDTVPDINRTVEELIDLGITRVLTSGQASSAFAGVDTLAYLQETYGEAIEILPAAGIGPDNVCELVERTGCTQVHGSFSRQQFDSAGVVAEGHYRMTDRELVRTTVERLREMGE